MDSANLEETEDALDTGVKLNPYTVSDRETCCRLARIGVTGIITGSPQRGA